METIGEKEGASPDASLHTPGLLQDRLIGKRRPGHQVFFTSLCRQTFSRRDVILGHQPFAQADNRGELRLGRRSRATASRTAWIELARPRRCRSAVTPAAHDSPGSGRDVPVQWFHPVESHSDTRLVGLAFINGRPSGMIPSVDLLQPGGIDGSVLEGGRTLRSMQYDPPAGPE